MALQTKRTYTILLSLSLVLSLLGTTHVFVAEASRINIIDYELEGIDADTSQYYVLWFRGLDAVALEVNATVLEFIGSTG